MVVVGVLAIFALLFGVGLMEIVAYQEMKVSMMGTIETQENVQGGTSN